MATPATSPPRADPSPLWCSLTLVFLASLGTGAITNGIFFLAESAYAFSRAGNYWLAFAGGTVYILGAIGVGPALATLVRRHRALNTRAALAAILVAIGLACAVPYALKTDAGPPPLWTIWALVGLYGILSGALWPILESYIAGGRTGKPLRRATGLFSISWSGAIVVAFWAMAPLVQDRPLLIVAALGAIHVAMLALLPGLGPEPGPHLDPGPLPDADPNHGTRDRALLDIFRIFLPASYVLMSALIPQMPAALGDLGVDVSWKTPVVSAYLASKLAAFVLLERWHAWHHRPGVAWIGGAAMIGGFAACLAAPRLGIHPTADIALLLVGLILFGAGVGVIYVGALYYAMVAGAAAVDAGGAHEAWIGVGYALGPACGLIALLLTDSGPRFDTVVLLLALFVSVVIGLVQGRRQGRGATGG